MEKLDPYNNKEKYLKWKENFHSGESGISQINKEIFLKYLSDMESGLNVTTFHKKGARSYLRLNTIRQRIYYLMKNFNERFNVDDITKITEEQVHAYFLGMRNGEIKKQNGKNFISVKDYVQDFKAFWHWWQRVCRRKDLDVKDITLYLDTSVEKPKWVYLTEDEVKLLTEKTKHYYKVLIMFLFDTGIRAPTEVMNIRVADIFNDFKELNIRQETSKTFGRRIKLMLCSDILRAYVKDTGLKKEDFLFARKPQAVNKYLKRVAKKVFGDEISPAGEKYCNLTMYDFRHCSCCYWLPRYKSESALKYRFGWKDSDKIHYYSELLGMRDTISEDDVLLDTTKTEIEQKLQKSEKDKEIMQERMKSLEIQMFELREVALSVKKEFLESTNKNG